MRMKVLSRRLERLEAQVMPAVREAVEIVVEFVSSEGVVTSTMVVKVAPQPLAISSRQPGGVSPLKNGGQHTDIAADNVA